MKNINIIDKNILLQILPMICLFLSHSNVSQAYMLSGAKWLQSEGVEINISITYSYSNLLDGNLNTILSAKELRTSTEEALGLWTKYAPLDFIEVRDSGPQLSDRNYLADGLVDIRIGYHDSVGRSHGFFPINPTLNGLSGDIHLSNRESPFVIGLNTSPPDDPFTLDILEELVHEIGHALGLKHEKTLDAIMNPTIGNRYSGLGTSFLLPDDISGIQAIYGAGVGSVSPIPLPSSVSLFSSAFLLLFGFSGYNYGWRLKVFF